MIKALIAIYDFFTNPKNRTLLLFLTTVIFALMLFRQCGITTNVRDEVEKANDEIERVENNLKASRDTITQFKVGESTWRAEKLGYTIKLSVLEDDYASLFKDFIYEKNKPPKTIIYTEFITKDSIIKVPVYITDGNSEYDNHLTFSDSVNYSGNNYRYLNGIIPFNYNFKDSIIIPGNGTFNLSQGMNINLGLYKDKKTNAIGISAETDYPGVTFTKLEGAYILDDPKSRKLTREFRKQWSLGVSVGYGIMYDIKNSEIRNGPYLGLGLNYQPKFLQW